MRSLQRFVTGDVGLGLLSGVTATVLGLVSLQAWRFGLSTPMYYLGDTIQIHGYVQNILDSGWVLNGPRLNAPFGQEYHDFPLGPETLPLLLIKVVGALTQDAVTTVNVVFLLSFPAVAITAFWALRRLGIVGPIALVTSVIYAVLPFHLLQNSHHLLLATYYVVPLACFVLVSALEGKPLFGLGRRGPPRRWLPVLGATLLAALIASSGAYFAAFTLLLILPATLIGWLHVRTRAIVVSGVAIAGLIVLFLALNNSPTFLYWLQNGGNPDVAVRQATDTTQHQLFPINLVMPAIGHRISLFARIAAKNLQLQTGENGDPLGLFAAIGLVLLIVVALGAVVGLFRYRRTWLKERRLAALTIVAIAIATSGGLSTLIALAVYAQVRTWGRMSIFIGFFAVLAMAMLLSVGWRWARRRGWRVPAAVALILILGLATLDQTTPDLTPNVHPTVEKFHEDREFAQAVEAALPTGAALYQLPYRQYPEAGPREGATDYDNFRPYFNSKALRFSYGGMKGREAGWQTYVYGRDPEQALPIISLAGFDAVWVDRAAYADGGAQVERLLAEHTNAAPMVSSSGRYAVYDIRDYDAALMNELGSEGSAELASEILDPVWIRWRKGAWQADVGDDGIIARPIDPDAEVSLLNSGSDGRQVTVSMTATGRGDLEIEWPDGIVQAIPAGTATPLSRTIPLAHGDNLVRFKVSGPLNGADAAAEVRDLWVVDEDLLTVQPLSV